MFVNRIATLSIAVLMLGSLTACDVFQFSENREAARQTMRETLQNAREQWDEMGSDTYTFTYDRSNQGRVEVKVVDGEIQGATLSGRDFPESGTPLSVESLFDLAERSIGNENFSASFNQNYGFIQTYRARVDGSLDLIETRDVVLDE